MSTVSTKRKGAKQAENGQSGFGMLSDAHSEHRAQVVPSICLVRRRVAQR